MNIFPWFTELICWLYNAFTYIVPSASPGRPITNPTQKTTIFIVSPSFTGPLLYKQEKEYLEKKGFKVIVHNFSKAMEDIQKAAPVIKADIEKLGTNDVCLVGISSAGLVCYEYLNMLDGWKHVKNFIALASPFKGSKMAYVMYHKKTGRELVPNSSYIKSISLIEPKHLDKTFCIVARKDELAPRKSSVLKGAKLIEIPVIGHVHLHAFSKKTFDKIAEIAQM